jgi:hypothetical protein
MPRPRHSVLATQEPVLQLQAEIAQAELRLTKMKENLEKAIAAHREQIRKSLKSRFPEERALAASIATWWEVC